MVLQSLWDDAGGPLESPCAARKARKPIRAICIQGPRSEEYSLSRGRRLLLAQRKGPMLGRPPAHLTVEQRLAWRDIVVSCHDVLRKSDRFCVEIAAMLLAQWRADLRSIQTLRLLYRVLGSLLIPMRSRRRLIFGEHSDR